MRKASPRRALRALAFLLLLPLAMAASGCSEFERLINDEQALYTVSPIDGKTAAVTAYKGTGKELSIPPIIGGRDIVAVADKAFEGNTAVKSVHLPDSIRDIGADAFSGCSSLGSVNLGRVVTVGEGAFENCVSLGGADLVSASDIGQDAFHGCTSLAELTLGDGKDIHIKERSFSGCSSLATISGGRSARYETHAFSDCVSLETVTFNSKARLSGEVFTGCKLLYTVRLEGDSPPAFLEKWVSAVPSFPEWTTVIYSDSYLAAHRRYVYSDNDDIPRLFSCVVSGAGGAGQAVSIETACPVDPANGAECIDCVVSLPQADSAAGWQFMNSSFDEDGHIVPADGTYPNCGTNLTGAKTLVFYARTENGGEHISFFLGGCGREGASVTPAGDPDEDGEDGGETVVSGLAPYPDSTDRVYRRFLMSDKWQCFTIDLSQYDLSYLQCGFGFTCENEDCGNGLELYLDEIYFEGDFS